MTIWSIPNLGTELLEFLGPILDSLALEMVPLCYNCVLNYGLGVVGPKNSHGFWFHKVELMLGERAIHG